MLARHAERLAEPARPGAEQARVVERRGAPASRRAPASARARGSAPRSATPSVVADEVQAPVDPVGAVDVGVAGRQEHRRVARGAAGCRSRARPGPRGRRPRPRRSRRPRRRRSSSAPISSRRDLVRATRRLIFTACRTSGSRAVRASRRRNLTMQSTPPETIEKRSEVSDASTPASRSPRLGALATCMNSIPHRRPRR